MISHHAVLYSSVDPLSYGLATVSDTSYVSEHRLEKVGIDDVRALIAAAYRRPPGTDTSQTLLVATEFITEEAQQALLKIIEEPPQSTRFVFVLPQGYSLLPTLESRFSRVDTREQGRHDTAAFEAFKQASYAERLELIEGAAKRKDTVWQQAIKNGLTVYLMEHARVVSPTQLKELEYVVRTLLTRGASNKMLFEHLALVLSH